VLELSWRCVECSWKETTQNLAAQEPISDIMRQPPLDLCQGYQTQITLKAKWGRINLPEGRIMTTHGPHYNADATMAGPEPYQLQLLHLNSCERYHMRYRQINLAISTFVWRELVHSLAEHFTLNEINMLTWVFIIWKLPKSIAGRTSPRGPYVAMTSVTAQSDLHGFCAGKLLVAFCLCCVNCRLNP